MGDKTKKYLGKGIAAMLLFLVFTIMLCFVDVKAIGPQESTVGFAGINSLLRPIITVKNETLAMGIAKMVDILGLLAIGMGVCFAFVGLSQLIKVKNLFKVDYRLLLAGALYIDLGIIYAIFQKLIINFRPVLMDGVLEASYPSSHTLLTFVVYMTAHVLLCAFIKNRKLAEILSVISSVLGIVSMVGRAICGIHWPTDIIGALLLSFGLIWLFRASCNMVKERKLQMKAEKLF